MLGRLEQGSTTATTWWLGRARSEVDGTSPPPSMVVVAKGGSGESMGGTTVARGRCDHDLLSHFDLLCGGR
jgi:hypothetical protein